MQYAITIDGLGTGNNLWYFGSWIAPSWDSSSLWVPQSLELWPLEISHEADWLEGIGTISGGTFTLVGAVATPGGPKVGQLLYTSRPVSLAEITLAVASGAVSITTDDTTGALADTDVLLGREVISIGSHSGAGVYVCTKGRRGTQDVAHPLTEVRHLYDADYPAGGHVRHRTVKLYRIPGDATAYGDAELLWTGVVETISEDEPGHITISADGLLTVLSRLTICHHLWRGKGTVRPVGGSLSLSITGPGTPVASSGSILISTGQAVCESVVLQGTSGGQPFIRGIFPLSGRSTPGQDATEAWECFRTNGTGNTDALPLDRNIFLRILQHLTTSPHGGNGSYDVTATNTRAYNLGAGIPSSLIDTTRFEILARLFGVLAHQDLYLGESGEPIPLGEHIARLLVPYGCCLVERAGKISCALFADSPSLVAPSLAETDFWDEPGQARLLTWGLDEIEATWGKAPGVEPTVDTFREGRQARLNVYGGLGTIDMDMSGIQSRQRATVLAGIALQRRASQPNRIQATLLRTSGEDLEVGDVVEVTHSRIRDTAGARGVTSARMLVESHVARHQEARVVVELLDLSGPYSGDARVIAPSGIVASYDGGTKKITLLSGASGFTSGDVYASDAASLSDSNAAKISICSRKHVEAGTAEVVGVVGNEVEIKNETTTPTAGQIIKLADYDDAGHVQATLDRFAWLADANDEVDGDATAFAEWTMAGIEETV